mgnify:FL=1
MNSIFNYQTLKVNLSKPTKTLFIEFQSEYLSWETLFELESLLAWSSNKIEIKSILISSKHSFFSEGHNPKMLKKMSTEKLQQFTQKLQKINYALHCLPQTVICDLKDGAKNIALELAMSCDIRIASNSCTAEFDHTKIGVIPCSGGISTLTSIIGAAHAKNWMMSGELISTDKLLSAGFLFKILAADQKQVKINQLLTSIYQQMDVQRIQTKLGLTETYREKIETINNFETKLANAANISEDWKTENISSSMPAKHMATVVKLSLVKNDAN